MSSCGWVQQSHLQSCHIGVLAGGAAGGCKRSADRRHDHAPAQLGVASVGGDGIWGIAESVAYTPWGCVTTVWISMRLFSCQSCRYALYRDSCCQRTISKAIVPLGLLTSERAIPVWFLLKCCCSALLLRPLLLAASSHPVSVRVGGTHLSCRPCRWILTVKELKYPTTVPKLSYASNCIL